MVMSGYIRRGSGSSQIQPPWDAAGKGRIYGMSSRYLSICMCIVVGMPECPL